MKKACLLFIILTFSAVCISCDEGSDDDYGKGKTSYNITIEGEVFEGSYETEGDYNIGFDDGEKILTISDRNPENDSFTDDLFYIKLKYDMLEEGKTFAVSYNDQVISSRFKVLYNGDDYDAADNQSGVTVTVTELTEHEITIEFSGEMTDYYGADIISANGTITTSILK